MFDLNNLEEIKKMDPKNVYGSTELFPQQCEEIWENAKSIEFPAEYKDIENIVICGMGGSAYGGHVALSAFINKLKIPLFINNSYVLPNFANENTLVLLTSYSGTTEEILSCEKDSRIKNCKISGLTSGGKLGDLLKESPSLIFKTLNNPSGQPRLGTGYIVLGTIALLTRLGVLEINDSEVLDATNKLRKNKELVKNEAQKLARELVDYIPVVFTGDFLEGNGHILRNQFNETSKSFSSFHVIPELNHHLMEGLQFPKNKKIKIIFFDSELYSQSIRKRFVLTKDVVSKNGIEYLEYKLKGATEVSQVLEMLALGGYLTLYLSLLYGEDPSLIPWVDYFKEQLKK